MVKPPVKYRHLVLTKEKGFHLDYTETSRFYVYCMLEIKSSKINFSKHTNWKMHKSK